MHDSFSIRYIDIKFTPDSKFSRQVDPWLDRKASSRQEPTTVLGFQVVDIGSITMDFLTDRVAGPMNEEVAVACCSNRITADIIDFPSARKSACSQLILDKRQCRIAPALNMLKDHALPCWYLLPGIPCPSDIPI